MNKTLRISFSLKNTYRVNGILFSLKQIPLLKRLLPATLYQVKGLKVFANILSVLWEIVSAFLGKFLYFVTMVCGVGILYKGLPENEVFLHILLFLTVIGSFENTHIFNPTKDKYYAMILMRMNAWEYTLVNYFYSILKVIIGFMPFTILFGMDRGVPLWFCLLLPLCIAGMKLFAVAVTLWDYEKRGFGYNENKLSKYVWGCIALLLAAAYAPPAFGFALPAVVPMVIFLACIPLGMASITRLTTFRDYYAINKELKAYNEEIAGRPQVIAANKVDVLGEDTEPIERLKKEFEPQGIRVFPISAVAGQGLKELLYHVSGLLEEADDEPVVFEQEYFPELENRYSDEPFTVTYDEEEDEYVVEGPRIEKMLGYTNLDSEKGFTFFQNFLKETGILEQLEALGIEEGSTVRMYGLKFDYYK